MRKLTSFTLLFFSVILFIACSYPKTAIIYVDQNSKDAVLDKVTSVLIENGYTISHSDKSLGLISTDLRPYRSTMGQTGMEMSAMVLGGLSGTSSSDLRTGAAMYRLTLRVQSVSPSKVKLNISSMLKENDGTTTENIKSVNKQIEKLVSDLGNYLNRDLEITYE